MTYEALLAEALALPEEEREWLRLHLELSLEESRDAEDFKLSPAQEKLLQERIADFEANPGDVMSLEEALRRADQLYEQAQRSRREPASAGDPVTRDGAA
jgi:hypothetical protein